MCGRLRWLSTTFWWIVLGRCLGWTLVSPEGPVMDAASAGHATGMGTGTGCVFAMYPHTSAWDFAIAPCMFILDVMCTVKQSLHWLRFLGFPVFPVQRGKGGESGRLSAALHNGLRIALWISGTRRKTAHVSSGFYHIARDAGVPVIMAGVDWRTKTITISRPLHVDRMSKDECLAAYIEFARTLDLEHAAKEPSCVSALQWRQEKEE